VPGNKQKSSGGSILIQELLIWKRGGQQWTNNWFTYLGKHSKDEQTRDERDYERELKGIPRNEMTDAEKYEADILQIDSLMYIPVNWGEHDSHNNKRR
jgi:hypothetical protein